MGSPGEEPVWSRIDGTGIFSPFSSDSNSKERFNSSAELLEDDWIGDILAGLSPQASPLNYEALFSEISLLTRQYGAAEIETTENAPSYLSVLPTPILSGQAIQLENVAPDDYELRIAISRVVFIQHPAASSLDVAAADLQRKYALWRWLRVQRKPRIYASRVTRLMTFLRQLGSVESGKFAFRPNAELSEEEMAAKLMELLTVLTQQRTQLLKELTALNEASEATVTAFSRYEEAVSYTQAVPGRFELKIERGIQEDVTQMMAEWPDQCAQEALVMWAHWPDSKAITDFPYLYALQRSVPTSTDETAPPTQQPVTDINQIPRDTIFLATDVVKDAVSKQLAAIGLVGGETEPIVRLKLISRLDEEACESGVLWSGPVSSHHSVVSLFAGSSHVGTVTSRTLERAWMAPHGGRALKADLELCNSFDLADASFSLRYTRWPTRSTPSLRVSVPGHGEATGISVPWPLLSSSESTEGQTLALPFELMGKRRVLTNISGYVIVQALWSGFVPPLPRLEQAVAEADPGDYSVAARSTLVSLLPLLRVVPKLHAVQSARHKFLIARAQGQWEPVPCPADTNETVAFLVSQGAAEVPAVTTVALDGQSFPTLTQDEAPFLERVRQHPLISRLRNVGHHSQSASSEAFPVRGFSLAFRDKEPSAFAAMVRRFLSRRHPLAPARDFPSAHPDEQELFLSVQVISASGLPVRAGSATTPPQYFTGGRHGVQWPRWDADSTLPFVDVQVGGESARTPPRAGRGGNVFWGDVVRVRLDGTAASLADGAEVLHVRVYDLMVFCIDHDERGPQIRTEIQQPVYLGGVDIEVSDILHRGLLDASFELDTAPLLLGYNVSSECRPQVRLFCTMQPFTHVPRPQCTLDINPSIRRLQTQAQKASTTDMDLRPQIVDGIGTACCSHLAAPELVGVTTAAAAVRFVSSIPVASVRELFPGLPHCVRRYFPWLGPQDMLAAGAGTQLSHSLLLTALLLRQNHEAFCVLGLGPGFTRTSAVVLRQDERIRVVSPLDGHVSEPADLVCPLTHVTALFDTGSVWVPVGPAAKRAVTEVPWVALFRARAGNSRAPSGWAVHRPQTAQLYTEVPKSVHCLYRSVLPLDDASLQRALMNAFELWRPIVPTQWNYSVASQLQDVLIRAEELRTALSDPLRDPSAGLQVLSTGVDAPGSLVLGHPLCVPWSDTEGLLRRVKAAGVHLIASDNTTSRLVSFAVGAHVVPRSGALAHVWILIAAVIPQR